ncbi:hypothetical protein, partial [Mycobacterium sp. 1245801.1]|uniref:hypothetical protein n=1 Tax=Mycobacterium sp. 1245801.1 TaxID=1834075 RepID=UPI0012E9B4FF
MPIQRRGHNGVDAAAAAAPVRQGYRRAGVAARHQHDHPVLGLAAQHPVGVRLDTLTVRGDREQVASAAAGATRGELCGDPLWSISEGSWTITDDERRIIAGFDERARERLNEMERERVAAQFAPGGASGRASDLFAITPDG